MSTARCRGTRYWSAATNAEADRFAVHRLLERINVSGPATGRERLHRRLGQPHAQLVACVARSAGPSATHGGDDREASMHTFVAILKTQGRSRPRSCRPFHAIAGRSIVSCTASSAAWDDPSIR